MQWIENWLMNMIIKTINVLYMYIGVRYLVRCVLYATIGLHLFVMCT
jgi:hypothetical protein